MRLDSSLDFYLHRPDLIVIKMSDRRLRLRRLIEHWAEHNDEHRARFEESAAEAAEMGLDTVTNNLKAAAERSARVSEHLRRALEAFE